MRLRKTEEKLYEGKVARFDSLPSLPVVKCASMSVEGGIIVVDPEDCYERKPSTYLGWFPHSESFEELRKLIIADYEAQKNKRKKREKKS